MPGEDTKIAGRIKERNGSECTGSSKGGGVYGRVSRLSRLVSRSSALGFFGVTRLRHFPLITELIVTICYFLQTILSLRFGVGYIPCKW